jgi:hypothetical protein
MSALVEAQLELGDEWRSLEIPRSVRKLEWSEEIHALNSVEKERWAVNTIRGALLSYLPGAYVVHRGDLSYTVEGDRSFQIVGDLDVEWNGRAPLVEAKGFLPRVGHKRIAEYGPDQGLDFYQRELYLEAQRRSGRPFYVVWAWRSKEDRSPQIAGKRVDLLAWPPDGESLNRLRNVKGAKMAYWALRGLWTLEEIAADIHLWDGAPFQETLL